MVQAVEQTKETSFLKEPWFFGPKGQSSFWLNFTDKQI